MSENASTRRLSTRALSPILGLALLAALAVGGLAAVGGGAQGEPPERLTEAEILSRLTAAPEEAPPFRATVSVEQTLVPEGLIGASEGDAGSGSKTARIWYGGTDQLRAELQGENGDQVIVRNGDQVSIYDGASNSLKTGEKPPEADDGSKVPPEADAASPEEVQQVLAEISPTSNLTAGEPVEAAGRWAYPLTLTPKDKDQTLVERAETLVDAETFLPLGFELYAEDVPEPVATYEAQNFEVGPVPEGRFQLAPPPGATVERLEPERGARPEGNREYPEPRSVASVEEASEVAGFPVQGLAEAPGGRELEEIGAVQGGAALRYGSGWGTVVLTEKQGAGDAGSLGSPEESDGRDQGVQIPTVGLGNGVEARELSTPVGTALSWSSDGVTYTLAGSVTATELEQAARDLVR